jgi:general secretion pathway protein G
MKTQKKLAFTLIELLIVVAIIAILAAIAVPNFLEAQVRAKVSRTKTDMRSISVAIESYYVDHNRYAVFGYEPQYFSIPGGGNPEAPDVCARSNAGLTSPIAYITSITPDPFGPAMPDDDYTFGGTTEIADGYYYNTKDWFDCRGFGWGVYTDMGETNQASWVLQSKGPDKYFSHSAVTGIGAAELDQPLKYQYDATNGTISVGNIIRTGP